MTASTDRRGTLVLGLAAAVAPAVVSTRALALPVERLIDPPEGPMRYSRSVTRDLIDGTLFTVTRDFSIEFRRFSEGFMLRGEQQDVRIDAPEGEPTPVAFQLFADAIHSGRQPVSDVRNGAKLSALVQLSNDAMRENRIIAWEPRFDFNG